MFLFSRISCVSVVALFFVTSVSIADDLPVGAWKLHVGGEELIDLVITEVKSDGKVIAQVFGRPIREGKWDGTKLSFQTGSRQPTVPVQRWTFEGWMVKEKQGENVRYTLTGNFTITGYCIDYGRRGWYAHHDLVEKKK